MITFGPPEDMPKVYGQRRRERCQAQLDGTRCSKGASTVLKQPTGSFTFKSICCCSRHAKQILSCYPDMTVLYKPKSKGSVGNGSLELHAREG